MFSLAYVILTSVTYRLSFSRLSVYRINLSEKVVVCWFDILSYCVILFTVQIQQDGIGKIHKYTIFLQQGMLFSKKHFDKIRTDELIELHCEI